jgi:hypothetical protein
MAQIQVTPIHAGVHYDDSAQKWTVKASRQEKENGSIREWVDILGAFATLAEAIAFLLAYWGATGTVGTTAPMGDMAGLAASLATSAPLIEETIPAPPVSGAEFAGTTLDGTEFNGAAMHPAWGVTSS